MGLLSKLTNMNSEEKQNFKIRLKEAKDELRIRKLVEERDKSPNQRLVERHFKEQEEEKLKEMVDKINKKRTQDSWKGKSILKGHKSILLTGGVVAWFLSVLFRICREAHKYK